MKIVVLLVFVCFVFCDMRIVLAEGKNPAKGDAVMELNLDDPAIAKLVSNAFMAGVRAEIVKVEGRGNVLKVTADKPGNNMVRVPFEVGMYRGFELEFCYEVKAENVSDPGKNWLGIKHMLVYKTPEGEATPQHYGPDYKGTFDWKAMSFSHKIPDNAPFDGHIAIGVQMSTGTVWFDNIKVRVKNVPAK